MSFIEKITRNSFAFRVERETGYTIKKTVEGKYPAVESVFHTDVNTINISQPSVNFK